MMMESTKQIHTNRLILNSMMLLNMLSLIFLGDPQFLFEEHFSLQSKSEEKMRFDILLIRENQT